VAANQLPSPLVRARPFSPNTSRGEKNMFTAESKKNVKFIKPLKPSKPIHATPPAKATKKITPEIPKVK